MQNYSILVVVDRLTILLTLSLSTLLIWWRILSLHGIPLSIISFSFLEVFLKGVRYSSEALHDISFAKDVLA